MLKITATAHPGRDTQGGPTRCGLVMDLDRVGAHELRPHIGDADTDALPGECSPYERNDIPDPGYYMSTVSDVSSQDVEFSAHLERVAGLLRRRRNRDGHTVRIGVTRV